MTATKSWFLTCDGCGDSEDGGNVPNADMTLTQVRREAHGYGWHKVANGGRGWDICDVCWESGIRWTMRRVRPADSGGEAGR